MPTPCHILVESNPVVIYASRNGSPDKVLPILNRFVQKFWEERETAGENRDTPECLVAQILVRFGYEICEDDFSNLRVGVNFAANVKYLYFISLNRQITVWVPDDSYHDNPTLGLKGCRQLVGNPDK